MSPNWLNKLLHKPQTLQISDTSTHSPSTISPSGKEFKMTTEPEDFDPLATPRIFALVISVDRYKSEDSDFENLTGCKNDGNRFIKFLTGVLGVPSTQIEFLADEEATEGEIVKRFEEFLIGNASIQRDDAIVFYFSGHGYRTYAPPGWVTESGTIEILCPHDVRTTDSDGNEIWGISDRAIDELMRRLACAKGDNIVAIFDCCHSGGLSRAPDMNGLRAKSIPQPPYPPPADLNGSILKSAPEFCARAAKTVPQTGFQYKAMASHVVLAACRPDEIAYENPSAKDAPGGLFTAALLEALRSHGLHETTYDRLFEVLDVRPKCQHPQCEGVNRDRLLFSVNTLRDGEMAFKVFEKGNRLHISAGSIHGIAEDTQFSIATSTQTLVLKAKKVRAFDTILEGSHHNITSATARVSHWHHPTLRVHSPFQHSSAHVAVVPADEPAEVALRQDESGEWVLERSDPLTLAYSDRFIRLDADTDRMNDILDAIANFNSYLYRSEGAAASFAGKVHFRMNRIGLVDGEINPIGDDLLDIPRTSHSGVEVKEAIVTDLESRYSLTLENHSEVDLFPYLFYFDPSDYSVEPWYQPISSMTAPLKGKRPDGSPSVFALGYGAFGTNPVEFYLPSESRSDSGFLKVFLTTSHVDMTHIVQPPIRDIHGLRGLRNTVKGTWTCETFVITCMRE